jgi:DNA-binding LytR/AlgR family response regulator
MPAEVPMDKLYIAACDDEPEILDVFARLIQECFAYHNIQVTVDKYNDPIALIKGIKSRSYDLLFLDIDMPHVDGITLAKGIRDAGIRIDIIYVSNKEELVFKVFDIQLITAKHLSQLRCFFFAVCSRNPTDFSQ